MNEGEFATRLGLSGCPRGPRSSWSSATLLVGLHPRAITPRRSPAANRRRPAACQGAGLRVTAGVSINHLTLNENDIGPTAPSSSSRRRSRHEVDRRAVAWASTTALIDVIVSDHNPQDVDTKRLPFAEAADGAVGPRDPAVRRLFASSTAATSPTRALRRAVDASRGAPRPPCGDCGRARPPISSWSIPTRPVWSTARSRRAPKNTPFDGARLSGRVLLTLVAGRTVYEFV